MKLLIFITKQTECINPILHELLREKISGATVIDCMGMLKSLNESSIEPPPIFGSLRHFVNPGNESVKLLMIVARDEERMEQIRQIIHRQSADLAQPNTGILFEVPVDNVEGVPKDNVK